MILGQGVRRGRALRVEDVVHRQSGIRGARGQPPGGGAGDSGGAPITVWIEPGGYCAPRHRYRHWLKKRGFKVRC